MQIEKTLPLPLNGREVKQIITKLVENALNADTTLVNDITYPGFGVKFTIDIAYKRHHTPSTTVWKEHSQGERLPDQEKSEKVTAKYETDSPNRAREENGLKLPIQVRTAQGLETVYVDASQLKPVGASSAKPKRP